MLLSAIFPGGGQLYAERLGAALLVWVAMGLLMALTAAALVMTEGRGMRMPGVWVLLALQVAVWLASIVEAGSLAEKWNRESAVERPG